MSVTRSPVITRHKKQPNEKQQSSNDAAKTAHSNSDLTTILDPSTRTSQDSRERRDPRRDDCKQKNENDAKAKSQVQAPSEVSEGVPVSVSQASRKTVSKLDDDASKPWDGCTLSRSFSDSGSSGSETVFCKGGPGKVSCGDPVLEGEMGVRCDGCSSWYHASCQDIVKEAFQAIELWHPVLSWLCPECKVLVKRKDTPDSDKLGALEEKVERLDNFVRIHMRTVEKSLKEQERASVEQGKLLEHSIKEDQHQKATYADMVKGSCAEVLEKVSSHVTSLPTEAASKGQIKTAQDLSVMFDNFQDKEKRKLNVVVHNLKEPLSESFEERAWEDARYFEKMIGEAFSLKVACVRSFRVGKKIPGKERLLIVSLESFGIRQELLRMAPQLRSSEAYSGIYINPDLTLKEREQGKKLREELAVRKQKGEKNLTIRKGKIVCLNTPDTGPGGHFPALNTERGSVHQATSAREQAIPVSTPLPVVPEPMMTSTSQTQGGKQ